MKALFIQAVIAALLLGGVTADAEVAAGPFDDRFQIDWKFGESPSLGASLSGYISNRSLYFVSKIHLRIEVLDASGAVIDEQYRSVIGDLPITGRLYFYVPLRTTSTRYRVSVHAFEQFGER